MPADTFEEDEAPRRGPGRECEYTEEVADHICTNLAYGTPLAQICRSLGIGRTTVYDWQKARPDFAERIARARLIGYDAIADDCILIADDKAGDVKLVGDPENPSEVCNTEFVQRAKLRIETRLKLLAKWDPKRYGDKLALAGDETAPLQVVINKPA